MNLRPSGYEPDELSATSPRDSFVGLWTPLSCLFYKRPFYISTHISPNKPFIYSRRSTWTSWFYRGNIHAECCAASGALYVLQRRPALTTHNWKTLKPEPFERWPLSSRIWSGGPAALPMATLLMRSRPVFVRRATVLPLAAEYDNHLIPHPRVDYYAFDCKQQTP